MSSKIIYTKIDEAPALATHSLLPILQSFTKGTGIEFESWDISLAGRIIANFPDFVEDEQKIPDYLTQMGELAKTPEANIVKLPNISATPPQLKAAITELQEQGIKVPDYPEAPKTAEEQEIQKRYSKVLGSAVNPVLREGNSDRRAAASVKAYGQKNPHRMMKPWPEVSKARVAHMEDKDFFGSEKSITVDQEKDFRIEFHSQDGKVTLLRDDAPLQAGEVVDCSVMSVAALRSFFEKEIEKCLEEDVLLSLHLKATMMKVSDPIMFGHCVSVYYKDVFEKHADLFSELGVNPNNGIGDVYQKLESVDAAVKKTVEDDIQAVYAKRPGLAMVDSSRGITNLHVPNDIIIDASVPVVVRDGGKMWGADDKLHDAVAMIPDRSYATMYQAVFTDCQQHGAFDPATMGTVANVGLMAQKAEEYGSHDKTFEAPGKGVIKAVSGDDVLLSQDVETGDIFRMCQTKDAAIADWVKLAINRARLSDTPAVFWLNEERSHDKELIEKVDNYILDHDLDGLKIFILPPLKAMEFTLERIRKGEDTIAVTGNVLRDYLTDLFPILELGTSAKMLSIVPLMNGGGLFETGAGGSAPKHVQQFLSENHLRWDSLGEFCALVASFEHLANTQDNSKAAVLASALDNAIGMHLENGRAPSRKVMETDNRGSHYYLAAYWAKALSEQDEDGELKARFTPVAEELAANESAIIEEMNTIQGAAVDIGGYFNPDDSKASAAMRPSKIFNDILAGL